MKITKNLNLNIIKKLMNYSNDIANMYNELYKLEISGQKKSKLYFDIISFIEERKELEQQVYYSIPFEYLVEYYHYFFSIEKELSSLELPANKILFLNQDSYTITRITNRLMNLMESSKNNYDDWYSNSEYYQQGFGIIDFDSLIKQSIEVEKFQEYILNTSIIFLNELIDDSNDKSINEQLKKIKYTNSYFNPLIEEIYLLFKFNLGLFMVNRDKYKDMFHISSTSYSSSIALINELLSKEYDNRIEFLVNLSVLKAYLYYLSSDTITNLINNLNLAETNNTKVKTKLLDEMNDTLKKISK